MMKFMKPSIISSGEHIKLAPPIYETAHKTPNLRCVTWSQPSATNSTIEIQIHDKFLMRISNLWNVEL